MRKRINGLKGNLRQDLEKRVVEHRNRFISIFLGRYKEFLPQLILYNNIDVTSINPLLLENALRNDFNVVVGQAKNGKIMILGYVERIKSNDIIKLKEDIIEEKDIKFIIPDSLKASSYKQISYFDDCKTGNFIVMKNKAFNYISDYAILEHYTIELAEIVLSRFSLSMQSKINTFFIGNHKDESIEQLVNKLYNGSPYIAVNKFFNPKDNIVEINNSAIGHLFTELKREYQNKIAELNNMLGINSLAVEKSSGVSDTEAKSNTGYTTSNANIYLGARQNELDKLNKRFGLNISVFYNDEVKSQLLEESDLIGDEDGL